MNTAGLLLDAFGRVHDAVHRSVDRLSTDQLHYRPDDDANSIAWLIWHLTRIQDDHVAAAKGSKQVWTSSDWARRFALPLDDTDTGFGHTRDQVATVKVESAELLTGYYDAVHESSLRYVKGLTDGDLDRVVDESWDPPVSLGVRLISVISDSLEHAGQAAYLRGLVIRL